MEEMFPTSKLGLRCVSGKRFREAHKCGSDATSILSIHDKLRRLSRIILKTKHLSHRVEWKNMCTHMKEKLTKKKLFGLAA